MQEVIPTSLLKTTPENENRAVKMFVGIQKFMADGAEAMTTLQRYEMAQKLLHQVNSPASIDLMKLQYASALAEAVLCQTNGTAVLILSPSFFTWLLAYSPNSTTFIPTVLDPCCIVCWQSPPSPALHLYQISFCRTIILQNTVTCKISSL